MALQGRVVPISTCAGVALYPTDSLDAESLVDCADSAVHRVKRLGRNSFDFYSRTAAGDVLDLPTFNAKIRRALIQRDFIVHYQPQVNIRTLQVIGLEAFVRWQDPKLGLLAPASFLPHAEETGTIVEIGAQVLQTVCRQGAYWQRTGLTPVRIGVNISPRQISRPNFVRIVEATLAEAQFLPRFLELELPERIVDSAADEDVQKIRDLKALGVSLAVNGFGLIGRPPSFLGRLQVNRLKVEKSLMAMKPTATLLETAGKLNIDVIIEGAETEEEVLSLRRLGCQNVQGYYYCRAVPPESIRVLLGKGTPLRSSPPEGS